MKVFDNAEHELGAVDEFHFGDNEEMADIEPEEPGATDREHTPSLLEEIVAALSPETMPEELREKLLREGYVRLDPRDIFLTHRYILPEQIASAEGDRLVLNVGRDALLKR
jgi:hypothetical protein